MANIFTMYPDEATVRTRTVIGEAEARGFHNTAKALRQLLRDFESKGSSTGATKEESGQKTFHLELFNWC